VEFAEDQQTVQKRVIEAQTRIDTDVAGFHAGHIDLSRCAAAIGIEIYTSPVGAAEGCDLLIF
jgi:hypothetical protein